MTERSHSVFSRRPLAFWLGWTAIAVYLATPVFALLQWSKGISLRVPSLLDDSVGWTVGYYVAMTLLAGLMVFVPRAVAELLAILESATNLGLTAVWLVVGYTGMLDRATHLFDSRSVEPDVPLNLAGILICLGTILISTLARYIEPRSP